MQPLGAYLQFMQQATSTVHPATRRVFQALVEAILPKTAQWQLENYVIWSLDHILAARLGPINTTLPLANLTAEMLNCAACRLLSEQGKADPPSDDHPAFARLSPPDRITALKLLEDLQVDLAGLPIPYRNNPGLVLSMTGVLALLVSNSYYSEWSGYGTTQLRDPEQRVLEQFPPGWQAIGYPGPAQGYHALRGYLIKNFSE